MTDDGDLLRRGVRSRRNPGGSPPPSVLSLHPTIFLDPSNAASVTTATGISAIADLSGNGHNFTQAIAGDQPPYASSGINGKPSIQWTNSAGQGLQCIHSAATIFGAATTASIYIVWQVNALATTNPVGSNWGTSDNGDYATFGSAPFSAFCASAALGGSTLTTPVVTNPFVWGSKSQSGRLEIDINWAVNANNAANTVTFGASVPQIGNAAGGNSGVGFTGALVAFARLLTATEENTLRAALKATWGTP